MKIGGKIVKNILKTYLIPLLILFIFLGLGNLIHHFVPFIPGPLGGMFLLLIALLLKIVPYKLIEKCSSLLIKHMSFFLIPAGVSVLTTIGILEEYFISIVLILTISLLVVMISVGKLLSYLSRNKKEEKKND